MNMDQSVVQILPHLKYLHCPDLTQTTEIVACDTC